MVLKHLLLFIHVVIAATSPCESPLIPYSHPMLSNYTSKQLTLTEMNRCTQYPRCLLFDCCDSSLVSHVHDYFKNQHCHSFPHFVCMLSSQNELRKCSYDKPFNERSQSLNLYKVTITHQMVEDQLAELPPTHPFLLELLPTRKEFKLIYLIQGDDKKKVDPQVLAIQHDMIFLSYAMKVEGDLYFPKSNLCYGRLTLYLAARQLEISQGWLYNYFIFIDDDIDWYGDRQTFEDNLLVWQPAVGLPAYANVKYPKHDVDAISHADFIYIAYHREALEVLHPWILDYDTNCTWASQLLQAMESAALYRNHVLSFKGMFIVNMKHRDYPKTCWDDKIFWTDSKPVSLHDPGLTAFDQVMLANYLALPPALKHCAVLNLHTFHQGDECGVPKKKGNVNYHLMHYHPSNTDSVNPKYKMLHHYATFNQSQTCPIPATIGFDRIPPGCCSIDIVFA